jgi:hypothetical protein
MDPSRLAEPGLFMTDATQKDYSPEALEAIRLGMPADKHIILTGPRDFKNNKGSSHLKSLFNEAGYGNVYTNQFALPLLAPRTADAGTLRSMSQWPQSKWDELEEIAESTGHTIQEFSTFRSKIEEQYKDNACIVTMPGTHDLDSDGYNQTGAGVAESYLETVPGRFKGENIPGTLQDHQIWTAHHETDHCENAVETYHEYISDAKANRQYAQDLKEGRAADPEVPYFIRDMRAASAILGTSGDEYLTNGLSPLAGETPLSERELHAAKTQIEEAQQRIYNVIYQDTGILQTTLMEMDNSRMNARMVYNQSKVMLQYGAFDDIPYGKTTVERFVDGAERYGHEYFNVSREDKLYGTPTMPQEAYGIPDAASVGAKSSYSLSYINQ